MEEGRLTGFGLGFRPPHYKWITENHPKVDWFEIITENFIDGAPRPKKFLEKLRSNYPVATHGVSLSITSLEPIDSTYLKNLKEFVTWLEPEIVSDHLCWTRFENKNSHDLLPTPYTMQNLENVASKMHKLQDVLRRQFVLENPSAYVAFSNNEMTEYQFLTELCKKTGCGILLDVNNSYVNLKNLGWDTEDYFLNLPRDAVKQFHLAGHSVQDGILIDTHDHPVPNEVWNLYRQALSLWPHIPTLIEWDENIPEFEVLMTELDKARSMKALEIKRLHQSEDPGKKSKKEINLARVYEDFFKNLTTAHGSHEIDLAYLNDGLPVRPQVGFKVYNNGFFLRLEGVIKDLFPTVAWVTEEDGFHGLLVKYLSEYPPHHYSINYAGQNFSKFLKDSVLEMDFGVPQEVLGDIATLEWARVEVFESPAPYALTLSDLNTISIIDWETIKFELTSAIKVINLKWDIGPVWANVNRNEDPDKPLEEKCSYLVWRKNEDIFHTKLSHDKKNFLDALKARKSFKGACADINGKAEEGAKVLAWCVSEGLLSKIN